MPTPLEPEFAEGLQAAVHRLCRQTIDGEFEEPEQALGEAIVLYLELGILGGAPMVPTETRERIQAMMKPCRDHLMLAAGKEALKKLKAYLEEWL